MNEAFSANKITIIIYKRVFRAAVNTYVSLPIFRGLDARGGKNYEQAHTHMRDNHSNDNNNYYKLFETLKLIRIISLAPDVFITYLLRWAARAKGKNTSGVSRVLSVIITNSITA